MKTSKYFLFILAAVMAVFACEANPLTGKKTMAFVDNSELFLSSFQEYDQFLSENKVITGTPQAQLVARIGKNIEEAAEKWYAAGGFSDYLRD